MAKISFNKVTPIKNIDPKIINISGEEITVSQYLPIMDKAALVERLLNYSFDESGFASPIRLETYFSLELIRCYTNISITDKMIENAPKTYDSLEMNQVVNMVIEAIPKEEYEALQTLIQDSIDNVARYNTSFVGMLRTAAADYKNTQINLNEMSNLITDPEQLTLVKNILEKIG